MGLTTIYKSSMILAIMSCTVLELILCIYLYYIEEDGYYEDLYPDPIDLSDSDSVGLSVSEAEVMY
jgi:hypothetical protein